MAKPEKTDPLRRGVPIVSEDKGPSTEFLRQWDLLRSLQSLIVTGLENNIVAGSGLDGGGSLADGNVTINITNTAVTAGDYGSATEVPTFTANSRGQLTAAANVTINISALLDTLSDTQGTVLYRGASAWEALAPGTALQVLTTNGAAANPSWQDAASGFAGYIVTGDDNGNGPEFVSNGEGLPITAE